MSKFIRLFTSLGLGLALVLTLAFTALILLFDINQYKPEIQTAVKEQSGYHIGLKAPLHALEGFVDAEGGGKRNETKVEKFKMKVRGKGRRVNGRHEARTDEHRIAVLGKASALVDKRKCDLDSPAKALVGGVDHQVHRA